jgi:LPS O-antigen subunit length determinant protein (WzzB/FepE family)
VNLKPKLRTKQKEKVKLPPRKNRSIQQQISDKREEETQLDQELSNLTAQRDQLLEQLKQAQIQMEGGEATQESR